MVVGCLGEIVFQVSDEIVKTINNMQWSGSVRFATHQRHLQNALTEFTGVDPDKMSFDIDLVEELGADPMRSSAAGDRRESLRKIPLDDFKSQDEDKSA